MGVADAVVEAVAAKPILTAIVVTLLALVFGGYLFARRLLVSAMQGFERGREEG